MRLSPRQRSSRSRTRLLTLLVWLGVVLLVLLYRARFERSLATLVAKLSPKVEPITELQAELTDAFTPRSELQARIRLLENELVRLRATKELKDTWPKVADRTEGISVIRYPDWPLTDLMVVESGEAGELVYAAPGILLGEIIQSSQSEALARLLSHPESSINGFILLDEATIPVTFAGIGGGQLEALLPAGVEVPPESPVITEDGSAVFARISQQITSGSGEVHARAMLLVNPWELHTVLLNTPYTTSNRAETTN